jgi:hypothetical protein
VPVSEPLRYPRAERVGQQIEQADLECVEEITKGVGIVATNRRLRDEVVAEHVVRCIPGYHPKAVGKAGELKAPMHAIGADAVQQHQSGRLGST